VIRFLIRLSASYLLQLVGRLTDLTNRRPVHSQFPGSLVLPMPKGPAIHVQ
jgi:hypothetical protein